MQTLCVLYFLQEEFLCCKPEWFVEHCKLVKVMNDDYVQTVRTVVDSTWDEIDRTSTLATSFQAVTLCLGFIYPADFLLVKCPQFFEREEI
jgi:hypothetical protein